jgi:hypothetical protein
MDPHRKDLQYELEKKKNITADGTFRPADGYKTVVSSAYKYMEEKETRNKNYRNQDGKFINLYAKFVNSKFMFRQSYHCPT